MKKQTPWVALAVVVIAAIVILVVRSRPDNSPAARAARLEHQLACPVCEGQFRADIPVRIREGQSDAEIRAAYVRVWGDRVLLTPSNSGLGIIVWAIPILVIVLGGAFIVLALRRWSRTPRLVVTDDDEDIVRRARLEADGGNE
jgi:cytochrome c-type biogenesis protein CcmH